MNAALGLSFGRDRVFLVHVSRDNGIVKLHFATSVAPATVMGVSMQPTAGTSVARVAEALRGAIAALPSPCTRIAAALPASWAFVHSFPAVAELSPAALQERSGWEITQHCAGEKLEEYAATVFPLMRDSSAYLSVAYPKQLLQRLNELLGALGLSLTATTVDALCVDRAFQTNYADLTESSVAIVECGELGGTVTLLRGGRIAELSEYEELSSAQNIISAVEQVEGRAGFHAQEIFVWGELLTKSLLDEITAGKPLRRVRRCNAFRRVAPEGLSDRIQRYCQRTAHLFPAAMGAALDALDRADNIGAKQ